MYEDRPTDFDGDDKADPIYTTNVTDLSIHPTSGKASRIVVPTAKPFSTHNGLDIGSDARQEMFVYTRGADSGSVFVLVLQPSCDVQYLRNADGDPMSSSSAAPTPATAARPSDASTPTATTTSTSSASATATMARRCAGPARS